MPCYANILFAPAYGFGHWPRLLADLSKARCCFSNTLCPQQLYGSAMPKRFRVMPPIRRDYVRHVEGIINLKRFQINVIGLKVMVILMNGLVLPISGVAWGKVWATVKAG